MNRFVVTFFLFIIGVSLVCAFAMNALGFRDRVLDYVSEPRPSFQPVTLSPGIQAVNIPLGRKDVKADVYYAGSDRPLPVALLIPGMETGKKAERYRRFGEELAHDGMIAIRVHYADVSRLQWDKLFENTIDVAQSMVQADKEKIAVVGYSSGGTQAFKTAAADDRVKVLAVNSGVLPPGFTQEDAKKLPATLLVSGDKGGAYESFLQIDAWFKAMHKPLYYRIEPGQGSLVSDELFWSQWNMIRAFLRDNL